jgi:hypothetical protein
MYTVKDNGVKLRFTSFENVIKWAWNTHKIDFEQTGDLSEDDKHILCDELSIATSGDDYRVGFDGRIFKKES